MTLWRVLMLVTAFSLVLCTGCALSDKDVVGKYAVHNQGETGQLAVDVRDDGMFTMYQSVDGHDSGSGGWRLNPHCCFDGKGIEFDGSNYADEYRFTHRYGKLCIEVRPDHEYWCKL